MASRSPARSIDEYIAAFPPGVRAILKRIRSTLRNAAPGAGEKISYGIPALTLDGRALVYFAAFKEHIGIYPPVRGDAQLMKALARYRGGKGNLQLPLSEPMPYALIGRIAKARMRQERERRMASAGRRK